MILYGETRRCFQRCFPPPSCWFDMYSHQFNLFSLQWSLPSATIFSPCTTRRPARGIRPTVSSRSQTIPVSSCTIAWGKTGGPAAADCTHGMSFLSRLFLAWKCVCSWCCAALHCCVGEPVEGRRVRELWHSCWWDVECPFWVGRRSSSPVIAEPFLKFPSASLAILQGSAEFYWWDCLCLNISPNTSIF